MSDRVHEWQVIKALTQRLKEQSKAYDDMLIKYIRLCNEIPCPRCSRQVTGTKK